MGAACKRGGAQIAKKKQTRFIFKPRKLWLKRSPRINVSKWLGNLSNGWLKSLPKTSCWRLSGSRIPSWEFTLSTGHFTFLFWESPVNKKGAFPGLRVQPRSAQSKLTILAKINKMIPRRCFRKAQGLKHHQKSKPNFIFMAQYMLRARPRNKWSKKIL